MGIEENKEVVRKYIDKVNDCMKIPSDTETILERLGEFFSADYVFHTNAGEIDFEQDILSQARIWEVFPDAYYQPEDIFGEDDSVFTRFTVTGTHKGTFRGIHPTGIKINVMTARCFKLDQGKIAECWGFSDMLEIYRQLGVITSMREIVDKFNKSREV